MTTADGFLGWPACDRCGKPVTDPRRASLTLDTGAVRRQSEASKEWRRAKRAEKVAAGRREAEEAGEPERPFLLTWSGQELMDDPAWPPVLWVWAHDRCAPSSGDYEISGERLDSLGKALNWTLHLAEKSWFNHIAWESAVRRFWRVPGA